MPSQQWLAWQFLTAWLGEEGILLNSAPPFHLIAELAYRHRLEPLLGSAQLPPSVPSSLSQRFRETAQATRASQIERWSALQKTLGLLRDWPVVVFKGFAAAELLYPTIGARSMGDVDVLVRPTDFQGALGALRHAGFQQAFAGDPVLDHPTHHERELTDGQLVIDLHQGFTQAYRVPLDYEAIVARSLPWASLAPNARVLSPEDAVLAQVIHLGAGELTPEAAPVIGVCDLRLMLKREGPFWPALADVQLDLGRLGALASAGGAARMLYAVLAFASGLFPSLIPEFESQRHRVSPGVRGNLDRLVRRALPPGLHNPPRLEMLWRKAMLLPGEGRRALFLRQLPLQLRYRLGLLFRHHE